jgi:hypothetical protein
LIGEKDRLIKKTQLRGRRERTTEGGIGSKRTVVRRSETLLFLEREEAKNVKGSRIHGDKCRAINESNTLRTFN